MSKGYRSPTLQARRWEQQANAWVCPNRCGHDVSTHREYPATWQAIGADLVEVAHPRYRPGLFACGVDGCSCEHDASAS